MSTMKPEKIESLFEMKKIHGSLKMPLSTSLAIFWEKYNISLTLNTNVSGMA